jgi:hypothetical protein
MPASSMKTMRMASTSGSSKAAMLAVRVEKPPVPSVENVWQRASKADRPASTEQT